MDEMDPKEFVARVGFFFILIGLGLMVLFIFSDIGQQTQFNYFFYSVGALLMGFWLRRGNSKPRPNGNRFEGLRKIRQKQAEAAKKREEKKKGKK